MALEVAVSKLIWNPAQAEAAAHSGVATVSLDMAPDQIRMVVQAAQAEAMWNAQVTAILVGPEGQALSCRFPMAPIHR
jgi:hypothetical protein